MNDDAAGKRRRKPSAGENAASERTLIRKSMARWEGMDVIGRRLGRGLGRRALIERVALEVGTSMRCVESALKA